MPKQTEMPGMERPKILEIEEAAEKYVKVRDRRMKLTEEEIVAKANLLTTVQAHAKELPYDGENNRLYRFDDLLVILKPGTPNVKVKHADADEGSEDDD